MIRAIKILILAFAACLVVWSCSSSQDVAGRNVAGIYMSGINYIDPEVKVFHANDTVTNFYFKMNSENLLYTKRRSDTDYTANVLINYELISKEDKSVIKVDSVNFVDVGMTGMNKVLESHLALPTTLNKRYDLVITFTDQNRDNFIKKRILLNRSDVFNHQHFLPQDTLGNIIFKNYFKDDDVVDLQKSTSNSSRNILLKKYKIQSKIARPPFSDKVEEKKEYQPDSVIQMVFDENDKVRFKINVKGLYHFQSSESNAVGPTFYSFQENFPEVKNVENMIEPMRYITTKSEYQSLKEAEDKKLAMDNFWLDKAGNLERARTIIKEYFSRVEKANEYFTSHLEGWKTDRGLIYMIYGNPNVVYKNKDYETWIYGEENNVMSMNFMFYKVNNPITNNDFKLNRSSIYKTTWYRAVDSWRSGRVY